MITKLVFGIAIALLSISPHLSFAQEKCSYCTEKEAIEAQIAQIEGYLDDYRTDKDRQENRLQALIDTTPQPTLEIMQTQSEIAYLEGKIAECENRICELNSQMPPGPCNCDQSQPQPQPEPQP